MDRKQQMERKAFVLLSGGLDSTTVLAHAIHQFDHSVEAVSIDYGQRHQKEIEAAREICEYYIIPHTVLSLRGLLEGVGVMLTDQSVEVPDISYADIKGVSPTYVPFRNGTMLSAITAFAQKYVMAQIDEAVKTSVAQGMQSTDFWKEYHTSKAKDLCTIYFGAHAEDAQNWAYPDCTPEFIGAMANAIYVGSYNTVRLVAPFMYDMKVDIVETGIDLDVPYELTWSCYKGEELHCGVCPTCRSRKKAFYEARVEDPTIYQDNVDAAEEAATPF